MADLWAVLEDTKFFQDLAARYYQEDYQGQLGYSNMGQFLRMAKRAGLERDKLGLDLACGNGRPDLFIIRRNRCNLVGLTASQAGLEVGQHRAERYALESRAAYVLARLNQPLPFAEASFDGVIATEGFEGQAAPDLIYREAGRVLKTGGGLAFFFTLYTEEAIIQEPIERQAGLRSGQADHAALLQQAGFGEIVQADATGELKALASHMKRAYEERGVLAKLRESLGQAVAEDFYAAILRLNRYISTGQVQRRFFAAKKASSV